MHPRPERILRQLLVDYGPALLDEPTRVDALLADLYGRYPRERFLLVHALRVRVSVARWPVMSWIDSCAQRLQSRYCFSAAAAAWAVESWSFALGVASTAANTNQNVNEISVDVHSKLSDIPQRTLYQLLTDWGPDLLNNPGRVDALLADLCGPFPRERFLLFHALRERIPAQLILAHALREHIPAQMVLVHAPRERALAAHLIHPHGSAIHANWLSQHLQNRYGFSVEAAQWAVEGCSFALNFASPVQNLTTPGKPLPFIDERMMRILHRDPRSEAWISTEVVARRKAKEQDNALATVRQKAMERDAAEEAVCQKAKEQDDAVAVVLQKAIERDAAEEAVRLKAKEQIEAVAVAGQKAVERDAAEEAVRQKAEKREAEKEVSLERANETIAAQETAMKKAEVWVTTEAADHQKAKDWGAAEEAVLRKAEEWVEAKTAEHQEIARWNGARATERRKAVELAAAEAVVLQKTEEWVETKTAEHQKTVEWIAAEAVVLQKIKEWVASKVAARKTMFEWAAAEKAARVKAEERSAADKCARAKAEERSAANKHARVKAEELSAAERAARRIALEEITLQIMRKTPMTSREVAGFLDREHEHAVSWLRRLQAADKVEYLWLKRSPHHPYYQTKEH